MLDDLDFGTKHQLHYIESKDGRGVMDADAGDVPLLLLLLVVVVLEVDTDDDMILCRYALIRNFVLTVRNFFLAMTSKSSRHNVFEWVTSRTRKCCRICSINSRSTFFMARNIKMTKSNSVTTPVSFIQYKSCIVNSCFHNCLSYAFRRCSIMKFATVPKKCPIAPTDNGMNKTANNFIPSCCGTRSPYPIVVVVTTQ